MTKNPRNIGYLLSNIFVDSKLTILGVLAILIFGVSALLLTPREENPQIIVPSAQIMVSMPGASSLEVEELIITPLEGILSEMHGVDHIYGAAMNSVGVITVQFDVGENKEESLGKLHDRVMRNRNRLPKEAGLPLIKPLDIDDIAVVTVTLASSRYDDYALKRIADRMAERLRSIESVSVVNVQGGRDREIRIDLDPERLQVFGIPLSHIPEILAANNMAAPVGNTIRSGIYESVFLQGFFQGAQDVRNLVIGQHENRPIYLGDIANIVDGPPLEREQISRFTFGSGDPRFSDIGSSDMAAVTLAVSKKKGTNAVFMANDTLERIERMRQAFIPEGVHLVTTRNDGKKANDAVNVLIKHLAIAVFAVFAVLIVFLGRKEALIVAMAVPLILLLTLGADFLGNVTINRVSLFALILSLGLLVDDSIVVIENIHRHYFKNGGRSKDKLNGKRRMTVLACAEVGAPSNLASFCIMSVFASLFFITGMPGQYFYPVAYNVPITMASALLIAYTFVPWVAYRWLHRSNTLEEQKKIIKPGRISRLYRTFILLALKRKTVRWSLYGFTLALLLLTLIQPSWQFIRPQGISGPKSPIGVTLGFLPKGDKNTFNVVIEMPDTTPVEITDAMVREINDLLVHHPLVINTQSWVGQSGVIDFTGLLRGSSDKKGSNIAEIRVNLVDKKERKTTSIKLVRELRAGTDIIKARYPGSVIQLVEDPPGPPMRATVLAEIYGDDLDVLRTLSQRVSEAFHDTYDMVDINDTQPDDVTEHRIIVDKEKSALSGISNAQVFQILRVLFEGEIIGRIHPDGEKNTVPIRIRVPHHNRLDPTQLDRVFVENINGKRIPLSELVKIVPSYRDRPILHKDNERVTFVGGELARTVPAYAVIDLNKKLDGMDIGKGLFLETRNLTMSPVVPDTIDGYQLLWDGEIRFTLDTFRDMFFALGLALTVVFLILIAYYQSFLIPIVAMSSIPLGLIGIFPGHWIMGVDFSATSMVGIIALSGVATRSSLLIIDFIRDNRKDGMTLHQAVYDAGIARALPIFLTTIAVVLGSFVMLSDSVFGGLAISLIFGTVVSSILTIIIVPVLYYRVEKWKQNSMKKSQQTKKLQARLTITILAFALLCSTSFPAQAETLHEVLVKAYNTNPSLQAQFSAVRSANEGVSEAMSGWRPLISVEASAGKANEKTTGGLFSVDETRTPLNTALSFNQPLYQGGRTSSAVSQARFAALARQALFRQAEQNLLRDTAAAYIDVNLSKAVLQLTLKNEAVLKRQLQIVRDRLEVGDVTITDLSQAEARMAGAEARRRQAEGNVATSRTVYRRIVGETPENLEDPVCLANLPETLETAIANATQKNPAIKASLLLEKAAEAGIDFAQSNLFPSLNLQASLAHTEEQLFRDSKTDIAHATLRLTIPLYQGGGEYSRIRKAKELKNQRLMEGRDTKRLIEENTVRVWESLETSLANIKSFKSQVTAMEKSLSGVRAEEEEGLRTILDVLDAERELLDAQVNLETANRNAFIAAFDLRAATGTLTAQALGLPVNVYNIREQY